VLVACIEPAFDLSVSLNAGKQVEEKRGMSVIKAFTGYVASPRDGSLKTVEFIPQHDGDDAFMGVWVDDDLADDIETPQEFAHEYGTLFRSVDDFKKDHSVPLSDYWVE
jgi:hypothetical protein